MPRSNRPRRAGRPGRAAGRAAGAGPADGSGDGSGDGLRGLAGHSVEPYRGVDHAVRRISGQAAGKTYRCPGCDHEVLPGTPHVVAWPIEPLTGGPGPGAPRAGAEQGPDRRHWHTPCWAARGRRAPRR